MKLAVICFTESGYDQMNKLAERHAGEPVPELYCKCRALEHVCSCTYVRESAADWAGKQFREKNAMLFISAAGIAVRSIAPFVRDKLVDAPVLVMDDAGRHIIPLLSGHVGGANALALQLAKELDASPVITTATDVHEKFAADVFAKNNRLHIANREGTTAVSAKALRGEPLVIRIAEEIGWKPDQSEHFCRKYHGGVRFIKETEAPEIPADVWIGPRQAKSPEALLVLEPKNIVLGIGCRRGKTAEEIRGFVREKLKEAGIAPGRVEAVVSIDVKADEEGLGMFAAEESLPFRTFSAEELEKVPGIFTESAFVRAQVGTGSVAERAAAAGSGPDGQLIMKKQAGNGITAAAAQHPFYLAFAEENMQKTPDSGSGKKVIHVVGMGPGREEMMTPEALHILEEADVIVGYTVYLKLLGARFAGKELLSTPMKQEEKRCRMCFEEAQKGKKTAMICSGDGGIYGMASLMYEIGRKYPDVEIRVVPGITAAVSGAAVLGAPLNHDFCVISLSDLLTPWGTIEKRLRAAAAGDFAIALYNPSSKKRRDYLQRACDILLETIERTRPCGYVVNIGRDGCEGHTCTLAELRDTQVDMFTTVFIGNSTTEIINGSLVTKRGYPAEERK